jgi:hypothetical protein
MSTKDWSVQRFRQVNTLITKERDKGVTVLGKEWSDGELVTKGQLRSAAVESARELTNLKRCKGYVYSAQQLVPEHFAHVKDILNKKIPNDSEISGTAPFVAQ